MSVLKDIFVRSLEMVGKLEQLASPPLVMNVSFDAIWLGDQPSDLMQVEVKNEHGELGWLYSKQSIVVFERNTILYGIKREDLRAHTEKELIKKVFIKEDEEPIHGVLKRVDKMIHAYVSFESLRPLITPL